MNEMSLCESLIRIIEQHVAEEAVTPLRIIQAKQELMARSNTIAAQANPAAKHRMKKLTLTIHRHIFLSVPAQTAADQNRSPAHNHSDAQ